MKKAYSPLICYNREMKKTNQTLETYNLIAKDYEKENIALSSDEEIEEFAKLLPKRPRVLDIGCGFGRELAVFVESGYDTYGIDGSKELLKLAKIRAPKAKTKLMDLRNTLSYEDTFFDGVWARNSLHHLMPNELSNAFSEIKRILKPNGTLFIEWKEGKEPKVTKEEIAKGKERYYNLMLKKDLIKLVGSNGFKVIKSYKYNWNERYGKKRQFSDFVVILASNA